MGVYPELNPADTEGLAAAARKQTDPAMHTAEHLLTAALMKAFGCGRPVTTHLEKKKSKADYQFNRALHQDEVASIEREVNARIADDLPVSAEFVHRDRAAAQLDITRLPDDVGDSIRVVKIGDYDACACAGKHVGSTREIGAFRIVSNSFADGILRVRFKVGRTASGTPS